MKVIDYADFLQLTPLRSPIPRGITIKPSRAVWLAGLFV